MKKIIPTALMILIVLTITSCTGDQRSIPKSDKDFHIGNDGLNLQFIANTPPPEVFENDLFYIPVKLWDLGAYDILLGYLTYNIENEYMCFEDDTECKTSKTILFKLDGKSMLNPPGQFETKQVRVETKKVDPQREKHTAELRITACYDYSTDLTEEVCIDPEPTVEKPLKKACEIKDFTYKGQGAPVTITKIETNMLPTADNRVRPQFLIYVENRGNGYPINIAKTEEACSDKSMDMKDWNLVYLTNFEYGNAEYYYRYNDDLSNIECKPNPLQLKTKILEGTEAGMGTEYDFIRCTVKEHSAIPRYYAAYKTQAYIKLDYGYSTTISKTIDIKKMY